jgi:hypothetical protein
LSSCPPRGITSAAWCDGQRTCRGQLPSTARTKFYKHTAHA